MGKRSWIEAVKRIFGAKDRGKPEKKEKRKKWFFGKLRTRRAITLPAASSKKVGSLREVEEEQSKRAMAVAVATAAAAEAAVAAAQAAAVVVRLTGTHPAYRKTRDMAAIKIQTAFRGYLARKALRALKAIVKLQALVRGRAVRRQTSTTLRSLQSLVKIQEQVRSHRLRISADQRSESRERAHRRDQSIKGLERSWNGSSLSKEAINAIISSRQEAASRREKAMEYASVNQRRTYPSRRSLCSTEDMDAGRSADRLSWLEQWVETRPWEKNRRTPPPANPVWDLQRSLGEMPTFRLSRSRRSFARDDDSVTSSPAFPSYMASTESAKAKARSLSTPKQRVSVQRAPSPLRQVPGEAPPEKMAARLQTPPGSKGRSRLLSQINPLH